MKSTGITRRIDDMGRFVLPMELRKAYSITTDTPLEIFTEGDTILLRKYQPAGSCSLCGEISDDVIAFHGKHICANCRRELSRL